MDGAAVFLGVILEEAEIALTIVIVEEATCSVHPALYDVPGAISEADACVSWHTHEQRRG